MARENKKDIEEIQEEEEKGKGKSKKFLKWIIIGTVILIIIIAGFAGWKYFQKSWASKEKAEKESTVQIGDIWDMGALIVNLMDGSGERYLKVTIKVETTTKECSSELNTLKPKILNDMLDLLSSKKYTDIVGYDGKQQLRDEIMLRLNNYLSMGRVKQIYFTEFVIQ